MFLNSERKSLITLGARTRTVCKPLGIVSTDTHDHVSHIFIFCQTFITERFKFKINLEVVIGKYTSLDNAIVIII